MAGLLKRGATWYARVYCRGRDRWRSLKTGSRDEAVRKAREFEDCLKSRQWVRPQLRDLLERARHEAGPDEIPLLVETMTGALGQLLALVPSEDRDAVAAGVMRSLAARQERKLTIAGGWQAWLNSVNRSQPKARTLAGYQAIWRRFADWAAERKREWLHEVDPTMAQDYAANLWGSKVTGNTFNAHTKFLKSAWQTLKVPAGITANPWETIRLRAMEQGTGRRALSPEEVRRVITAAVGPMKLLLTAGAMTGARLSDVVSMRWEAIDLEVGLWTFVPLKTDRTGKKLALPLLEPLLGALRAARKDSLSPWVFSEERSLWQRNDLTRMISNHFEACGIVTTEAATEGSQRRKARVIAGFHSLRHFAASTAAQSGANSLLVSKTLGHGSLDVTKLYVHAGVEDARKVLTPLAAVVAGEFTGQSGQKGVIA